MRCRKACSGLCRSSEGAVWEPFIEIYGHWDGYPLEGIASFRGERHCFRNQPSREEGPSDLYLLLKATPDLEPLEKQRIEWESVIREENMKQVRAALQDGALPPGWAPKRSSKHAEYDAFEEQLGPLWSAAIPALADIRWLRRGRSQAAVRWYEPQAGALDALRHGQPSTALWGAEQRPVINDFLPLRGDGASQSVLALARAALETNAATRTWYHDQVTRSSAYVALRFEPWLRFFDNWDDAVQRCAEAVVRFEADGAEEPLSRALQQAIDQLQWRPDIAADSSA